MRTVYISDDKKEFDDEFECRDYEWLLKHPHLKDVKCYDENENLLTDIMSINTYYYCVKIIVPTEECVKEINDLANHTGCCDYSNITEPGTWIVKQKQDNGEYGFIKEN